MELLSKKSIFILISTLFINAYSSDVGSSSEGSSSASKAETSYEVEDVGTQSCQAFSSEIDQSQYHYQNQNIALTASAITIAATNSSNSNTESEDALDEEEFRKILFDKEGANLDEKEFEELNRKGSSTPESRHSSAMRSPYAGLGETYMKLAEHARLRSAMGCQSRMSNNNPTQWTVDEVINWLTEILSQEINLNRILVIFKKEQIDGKKLLNLDEFAMPDGIGAIDQENILSQIDKLKKQNNS